MIGTRDSKSHRFRQGSRRSVRSGSCWAPNQRVKGGGVECRGVSAADRRRPDATSEQTAGGRMPHQSRPPEAGCHSRAAFRAADHSSTWPINSTCPQGDYRGRRDSQADSAVAHPTRCKYFCGATQASTQHMQVLSYYHFWLVKRPMHWHPKRLDGGFNGILE